MTLRSFQVSFCQVPAVIIFDQDLDTQAKAIYTNLLHRSMNEERTAFPSLNKLADDVGLSKDCVVKRLKLLLSLGLITKQRRFNETAGVFSTNIYTIVHPAEIYGDLLVKKAFHKPAENAAYKNGKSMGGGGTSQLPGGSTSQLPGGSTSDSPKVEEGKELEEIKIEEPIPGDRELSAIESKNVSVKEPEDLALAQEWLAFAIEVNEGRTYRSWTAEKFAKDLATVRRRAKYTRDQLREVLAFLRTNDFWRPNAVSPINLVKFSENGRYKIDNIRSAMTRKPNENTKRVSGYERMGDQGYAPFGDDFLARVNQIPT